jgi:hypothetical protein
MSKDLTQGRDGVTRRAPRGHHEGEVGGGSAEPVAGATRSLSDGDIRVGVAADADCNFELRARLLLR